MVETWVVTGASRGIGLELARQLAERGERVVGTARDPAGAEELAALDVRVEQLDVADQASVDAFGARLGDQAVDVLVNNAGVYGDRQGIADLDLEAMVQLFEVNTLGALRVTRALYPHLLRRPRRLIANVTSKMGSIDDNTSGGAYAYRASKCALNMVTKSLAVDLAPEGFVCALLHPGWVRTRMGGAGASLSVEESVAGLLGVIAGLDASKSGRFFSYMGSEIPW